MRAFVRFLPLVVVIATGGSAHALKQSAHRSISELACEDAGLPDSFCDRVGVAAYNVDRYEWSTPAAHAQMADGQSACDGANATLARVQSLGADVRVSLAQLAESPSAALAEHVASQLGRALHTVQDNCAHRGLPNAEHAWASMSDTCDSTNLSPDTRPDAFSCARDETEIIMDAFVAAVNDTGASTDDLSNAGTGWTHWPTRGDVCAFLASAGEWDGTDRHWNNAIMSPALRNQLTGAMLASGQPTANICAGGPDSLAPTDPAAPVNVAVGAPSCVSVSLYCVGKGDGEDAPPPWDDGADDQQLQPAGCAAGQRGGSGAVLMLAFAALIATRRRR